MEPAQKQEQEQEERERQEAGSRAKNRRSRKATCHAICRMREKERAWVGLLVQAKAKQEDCYWD